MSCRMPVPATDSVAVLQRSSLLLMVCDSVKSIWLFTGASTWSVVTSFNQIKIYEKFKKIIQKLSLPWALDKAALSIKFHIKMRAICCKGLVFRKYFIHRKAAWQVECRAIDFWNNVYSPAFCICYCHWEKVKACNNWSQLVRWTLSTQSLLSTLYSSSLIEERTGSSLFLTYFLHLFFSDIFLLLSLFLTPEDTKMSFSFLCLKRIFFPFTEEKMFGSAVPMFLVHARNPNIWTTNNSPR